MQRDFYKRLSYSFGNEDWRTEQKALRINSGDRVLCVTASGDRPLHLLLDSNCAELISVDTNVIQNHLLNLKKIAMQELNYSQYVAFLGAEPGQERKEQLSRILKRMDNDTAKYWKNNSKKVEKGVIYEGAVEKLLKKVVRPLLKIVRGKKIKQLFEFKNIDEQREFVKTHWDTFLWRKAFEVCLNPFWSKVVLNDPGLNLYVDPSLKAGNYVYQRMNNSLQRTLACENLMMSLILRGHVEREAFPAYLTEDGVKKIKPKLARLKTVTADLIGYIENAPESSIDCFSLSDVASYLPQAGFEKLLRAVVRAAKPGARVSIREFLSYHKFPEDMKPYFKRDDELEKELEKEDCCFVYRFIAATINK